MDFFVSTIDGKDRMPPGEAEDAWQACRKGEEGDVPDTHARRVYRLRYNHNGKTHEAVVGERDALDNQTVMAILAYPGVYKVCLAVRGFLKVGDTHRWSARTRSSTTRTSTLLATDSAGPSLGRTACCSRRRAPRRSVATRL